MNVARESSFVAVYFFVYESCKGELLASTPLPAFVTVPFAGGLAGQFTGLSGLGITILKLKRT